MTTIYLILSFVSGAVAFYHFFITDNTETALTAAVFYAVFSARWESKLLEKKIKDIERRLGIHHE